MTDKAIEAAIKSAGIAARNCGYDLPHSVVRAIVKTYEHAMWRPIEEAPKDKTEVLLFSHWFEHLIGQWSSNAEFGEGKSGPGWQIFESEMDQWYSFAIDDATHYRPLPPMPGNDW